MIKIHTDDLIHHSYDGITIGPETAVIIGNYSMNYKYKWDVGAESTISLYNDLLLKGNEHRHF